MRSLLAFLAICMFVATIGCNNAEEEKPAGGDKPAAGETEDGDKGDSASTAEPTAKMQEVSLTLPNVS